jgi:hypothetical protein
MTIMFLVSSLGLDLPDTLTKLHPFAHYVKFPHAMSF